MIFREDFCFETPGGRSVLPDLSRKPRLAARLAEKRRRVPPPLNSDLWQQQTSLASVFDEEAMSADFDLGRTRNALERPEQRDLDLNERQLRMSDGWKSRVGAAGGHRASRDDLRQQIVGVDVSDTSTQRPLLVETDKRAPAAGCEPGPVDVGRRNPHRVRRHRMACNLKQAQSVRLLGHDENRPIAAAM